jgi:tRNA-2-methylthio-N6-dimethylallyladenosine synthase
MPYLHLPVQSGSNRILDAMNRRHDRDLYLRIVDRLRNARADLALSSDFIVGFPGESDADFDDTMRLIEQVGFASAYAFRYSRRPGTPGAALVDQVPENVKVARLAALQALVGKQARDFNESKAGANVPVLFAEAGRKPGQIMGKTPWLQSVYAQGDPRLFGHIVDVRLIEGYANSLLGEIIVGPYEVAA